jgi:hypothetical protein
VKKNQHPITNRRIQREVDGKLEDDNDDVEEHEQKRRKK